MYLQNLQLTTLKAISGFKNVLHLRVEVNALTTFDGIQNMSKLQYLNAPALYSTALSQYTLGMSETTSSNSASDALSYIYKDANGKNTSLKMISLINSKNLKHSEYLKNCTSLSIMYLAGCSGIIDINTISKEIGQCGSNYTVDGAVSKSIISPNVKVLNLTNQTLTTTEFEKLKDGTNPNTSLTHLSLAGVKITNNGTQLTGTALNTEINSVLKYCVNLQYLQLYNQSGLSTIEFVKPVYDTNNKLIQGTPYLKELDLRGTSVRTNAGDKTKNGLELLNDLVKYDSNGKIVQGVRQMSVTGGNIDFSYIQPVVSCLDGGTYWYQPNWNSGLWCNNWTSLKTLEKCTEVKQLVMWWHNTQAFNYDANKILDLSGCTNMKYVKTCRFVNALKYPNEVTSISGGYDRTLRDFSNCIKLEDLYWGFDICTKESHTQEEYNTWFTKLGNCTNLKSIQMLGTNIYDFTVFGNILPNFTKLENLDIEYYSWNTINNSFALKDLSPLESAKSITTLNNLTIAHADNCTNLDWISNLENLTTLNIVSTHITRVPDLSKMKSLTTIKLNNNRINDISGLNGAKTATYINLQNNALFDTCYNVQGTPYYTLTIFADLNQNQDGSLQELYLAGNGIDDFSMLNDSNLKWNKKSGW